MMNTNEMEELNKLLNEVAKEISDIKKGVEITDMVSKELSSMSYSVKMSTIATILHNVCDKDGLNITEELYKLAETSKRVIKELEEEKREKRKGAIENLMF